MYCITGAMLQKINYKKTNSFEHEKIVTITLSSIITTQHYC